VKQGLYGDIKLNFFFRVPVNTIT